MGRVTVTRYGEGKNLWEEKLEVGKCREGLGRSRKELLTGRTVWCTTGLQGALKTSRPPPPPSLHPIAHQRVKMKSKKTHSSKEDSFHLNSRHWLGHISKNGALKWNKDHSIVSLDFSCLQTPSITEGSGLKRRPYISSMVSKAGGCDVKERGQLEGHYAMPQALTFLVE